LQPCASHLQIEEEAMRSVRAVTVAFALALAGSGLAWAQQPYPAEFANSFSKSCLDSCRTSPGWKGREALCPSYCTCLMDEAQASVPLEVALQSDKDWASNNRNSPAVERMKQVSLTCQSRVLPSQPANQSRMKR
jgi:hypothetical protein